MTESEQAPDGFDLDAEAARQDDAATSGMTARADIDMPATGDITDSDLADASTPDDDAIDDPDDREPIDVAL